MRDRFMEVRSIAEIRAFENRPSGLTKEERGRLRDLWNLTAPSAGEKKEIRLLQAKMR